MRKTIYRISVLERLIAGFLAVVIFFYSSPFDLSVFAEGSSVMGIHNNFLVSTEHQEELTKYIIKYRRKNRWSKMESL